MKTNTFYLSWAVRLAVLILAFAAIDYFFHTLTPQWEVPEYYFRNKIIFGFLWGLLILFFALKFSGLWQKSLFFSGALSVILQARYYWEGYPINFVIIFLFIHFLILVALSAAMFKWTNNYNKK